MDVRIGTTVVGQPAGFDTNSTRPLLLIGDVGRGKTTLARYLTRWWLADTARHAHVFAQEPTEWSDLVEDPEYPDNLTRPLGGACRRGTCLVAVDDIDLNDDDWLNLLPLGTARVILTSYGGNRLIVRPLLGRDITCLGLIRPEHADSVETAALDGQGRLDWPLDTVPVVPDARGPMDRPCHRWQAPTVNRSPGPMAVSR